jgi:SNF2 family DNA or RNA helicase
MIGTDGGPKKVVSSVCFEFDNYLTGSTLRRINLAEYATSLAISRRWQELIEMRQNRPDSKAFVFSQFVIMLDLIRWRLHSDPCLAKMGIGVLILHGGMNVKSRDQTLKNFREDNGIRVALEPDCH